MSKERPSSLGAGKGQGRAAQLVTSNGASQPARKRNQQQVNRCGDGGGYRDEIHRNGHRRRVGLLFCLVLGG